MKKLLLFAIVLLCAWHTSLAQSAVNVIIIEQDEQGHSISPRTPAPVPIQCYYYPEAGEFSLEFLSDMGIVEVVVTNLTEMTEYTFQHDTSEGEFYCPLDEGLISICITTVTGRVFNATFYAFIPNDL